ACTPLVSAAWAKPDSPYSATSAGTIAEAENQSAIAATWQIAMIETEATFEWPSNDVAVSAKSAPAVESDLRQRHPMLPLVLAATVLVRRLADFVGLEEDHLRDALVRIDLGGQRRRVRELERDV